MSAKWNSVEIFSIESATANNSLYANGRQSLRVRVAIKVLDINNAPVALSETERRTLTLVNYHGGAELKYRDGLLDKKFDKSSGDWDWSQVNIGDYHYFPAAGARHSSPPSHTIAGEDDGIAYIDLYVRSVSQIPMTVSLRITREDGVVFNSGYQDSGRLLIFPVRPRVYTPSDHQLEKVVIKPIEISSEGIKGLHYYRLGLKAEHDLAFKSIYLSASGLLGNIVGNYPGVDVVGYTKPGDNKINYVFRAPDAPQLLESDAIFGQVVFVRALSKYSNLTGSNSVRRPAVASCQMQAIDIYGNEHVMTLRFPNGSEAGGVPELV